MIRQQCDKKNNYALNSWLIDIKNYIKNNFNLKFFYILACLFSQDKEIIMPEKILKE